MGDTRRWMVDYRLKDDLPAGTGLSEYSYYMAGPFWSHDLAEKTLAALATNPAFRGGDIRLIKNS